MTREDARTPIIALIHMINGGATVFKNIDGTANVIMDQFAALGMLKLDEPKSAEDTLAEIFRGYVAMSPHYLRIRLDELGLKIVEK